MSLSPVATLVRLAGQTAVVHLRAPAPAYDPDVAVNGPSAPTATNMVGVYSKVTIAGIEVRHAALFLVASLTLPEGVKPGVTKCDVGGLSYTIAEADPRWYLGQMDGFNLHLSK